LIVTGVR